MKLDACYATKRGPAPFAARLVSIVEIRSEPRSMSAMLTKGFWALLPKSNFLSFFKPGGSVLDDCAPFTEESLGQN